MKDLPIRKDLIQLSKGFLKPYLSRTISNEAWGIESKALERSINTQSVGMLLSNWCDMDEEKDRRLVRQDLPFKKPCWDGLRMLLLSKCERIASFMIFSMILLRWQDRFIGRKFFGSVLEPDLNVGITNESFQLWGISPSCRDDVKIELKGTASSFAHSLRTLGWMPSGPADPPGSMSQSNL